MHDKQESHEPELAAELLALERQLRGMSPMVPRVNRDHLMFAAGQAAGTTLVAEPTPDSGAIYDSTRLVYIARRSWADRCWPAATFTMTAASIMLATVVVWQNRQQTIPQQTAPFQPAIIATNELRESPADEPQFTTRLRWSSIPSANSGYLGVRYVALTRGITAVPTNFQSSDNDHELPADGGVGPATPRGLLHELLPASNPANTSRS
jgi:hypothetical protein